MISLKERITKLNIIKKYLKYYFDCLPYYSKDKALSLLQDIDSELNWFKLQKEIVDVKNKQLDIFERR